MREAVCGNLVRLSRILPIPTRMMGTMQRSARSRSVSISTALARDVVRLIDDDHQLLARDTEGRAYVFVAVDHCPG